ncbi:hypothetical protein V6U71_00875 [Sphingopyxis sp. J-6]|uniref:hypothetical protein n=1 Tax=Sphingopyxis sp. J-6 TaxID=3122054 RepID=UPI003983E861
MRKTLSLLAAGAALIAAPAFAQVGGVADVNAGAQVGVNPAGTVATVTDRVGQTVDRVDDSVNHAVDATKLKLAAREDVRAGAQVSDSSGNSVGTVQSIDGDQAIVVDGGKLYNVPLSSLYSHAEGAAHGLVTKLPKADLKARAEAGAAAETR